MCNKELTKLSITNILPDKYKMSLRHPKNALNSLFIELFTRFCRTFLGSYSQHGEDIILYNLLKRKKYGFYIDIGANDPEIISNTMFFYKKGWRGINIEPHPEVFQKVLNVRDQDINLNIGIASKEDELTFYKLDKTTETAGSTFDKNIAQQLQEKGYTLSEEIKMPVKPLSTVLEENLEGKKIDFMSIDTEGFDLEVIKSNDWQKFRPELVIIETTVNTDDIIEFMQLQGYKIVYQNSANTIFRNIN